MEILTYIFAILGVIVISFLIVTALYIIVYQIIRLITKDKEDTDEENTEFFFKEDYDEPYDSSDE